MFFQRGKPLEFLGTPFLRATAFEARTSRTFRPSSREAQLLVAPHGLQPLPRRRGAEPAAAQARSRRTRTQVSLQVFIFVRISFLSFCLLAAFLHVCCCSPYAICLEHFPGRVFWFAGRRCCVCRCWSATCQTRRRTRRRRTGSGGRWAWSSSGTRSSAFCARIHGRAP